MEGTGQEQRWRRDVRGSGSASGAGSGSRRPTPHLTSPLEGGRDELGKMGDVVVGEVGGSCLRRNDEEGRRNDSGAALV